jgi:hypothetical protein
MQTNMYFRNVCFIQHWSCQPGLSYDFKFNAYLLVIYGLGNHKENVTHLQFIHSCDLISQFSRRFCYTRNTAPDG